MVGSLAATTAAVPWEAAIHRTSHFIRTPCGGITRFRFKGFPGLPRISAQPVNTGLRTPVARVESTPAILEVNPLPPVFA